MTVLSPQQFFHGTDADLQPGDTVVPGNTIGKSNFTSLAAHRSDSVWTTPDEHGAWWYANHAAGSHWPDTMPRSRVYEVEPTGTPEKRRRLSQIDPVEYTTNSARVKREIDIPPPDMTRHESGQGELPLKASWENYRAPYPFKTHNEMWNWSERNFPDKWDEAWHGKQTPEMPVMNPDQMKLAI